MVNKSVFILDNGTCVSSCVAKEHLLNIGDFVKYNTSNRGVRGIGRLAGLAYCDELVFSTSYFGEEIKTIITFNAKELRENLYSIEDNNSLENVFIKVVFVAQERERKSKHYFSVELRGVVNTGDILNYESVYSYLSQVAPVP